MVQHTILPQSAKVLPCCARFPQHAAPCAPAREVLLTVIILGFAEPPRHVFEVAPHPLQHALAYLSFKCWPSSVIVAVNGAFVSSQAVT